MDEIIEKYEEKDSTVNPFLFSMRIEYIENCRVQIVESKKLATTYNREVMKSTKVYHIDKDIQNRILGLSSGAKSILMMIIFSMSKNTERVRIHKKRFLEYVKAKSPQTFYNAINELEKANVICHYKPGIYWINVQIIFSGDRIKRFPDKAIKVGENTYDV